MCNEKNFVYHTNTNVLKLKNKLQVVLNANKLADLVEDKKSKQNWLDYYQNKYSRKPSNRPMMKVCLFDSYQRVYINKKFHIFSFIDFSCIWTDWFSWTLGRESGCY